MYNFAAHKSQLKLNSQAGNCRKNFVHGKLLIKAEPRYSLPFNKTKDDQQHTIFLSHAARRQLMVDACQTGLFYEYIK